MVCYSRCQNVILATSSSDFLAVCVIVMSFSLAMIYEHTHCFLCVTCRPCSVLAPDRSFVFFVGFIFLPINEYGQENRLTFNPSKMKLVQIVLKNSVRTSKRTQHLTVKTMGLLTLFKKISPAYSENHTKPTNTYRLWWVKRITTQLRSGGV
jgi:hypothetical protein